MAQHARIQSTEAYRRTPARRQPPRLRNVAPVSTDIAAARDAPSVGVHPVAIEIALGASVWFVLAMAWFFAGPVDANIALTVVVGFAVVFFGLTLGLARWAANDPRWSPRRPPDFGDFIKDNVAIETGVIGAREALVQIVTLPLVLAVGATAIGIVFRLAG